MPKAKPIVGMVGAKTGVQRLWEAIRARDGEPWTRYEVCRAADVDDTNADTYLRGLRAAGIIEICETVPLSPHNRGACAGERRYKLMKDSGIEAPRVRRDGMPHIAGMVQEQMWRALRMRQGDIDAHELSAYASTSAVPVKLATARDYILVLSQAGYLELTTPPEFNKAGKGGGTAGRYRLKIERNTGPRPPRLCMTSSVFDPNEDRVVWQAPVRLEDAV